MGAGVYCMAVGGFGGMYTDGAGGGRGILYGCWWVGGGCTLQGQVGARVYCMAVGGLGGDVHCRGRVGIVGCVVQGTAAGMCNGHGVIPLGR